MCSKRKYAIVIVRFYSRIPKINMTRFPCANVIDLSSDALRRGYGAVDVHCLCMTLQPVVGPEDCTRVKIKISRRYFFRRKTWRGWSPTRCYRVSLFLLIPFYKFINIFFQLLKNVYPRLDKTPGTPSVVRQRSLESRRPCRELRRYI